MPGQFSHKISAVRRTAAEAGWSEDLDQLLSTGIQGVPDLIEACLDEKRSSQQRVTAVRTLGEVRARTATAALLKLVDRPDQELSYHAAAALIGVRERRILPTLCRLAVDSPNWPCRAGAVWIMREMTDTSARRVLVRAVLQDPNSTVRREAAISLISYPGRQTFMALAKALSDPEPGVRDVSVFAVGCLCSRSGIEVTVDALRKLTHDRSVGTWGTLGVHARDVLHSVSHSLEERQRLRRGR
jgi:HEAT repeat protein